MLCILLLINEYNSKFKSTPVKGMYGAKATSIFVFL
jgi:hypothetical protein